MRLSGRIIAKLLMLCGISLACTACYAAPSTDFRPGLADCAGEGVTATHEAATDAGTNATLELELETGNENMD